MKTIRYTGVEFHSDATGRLTHGQKADVSDDVAREYVESYQFEYVVSEPTDAESGDEPQDLESLFGVAEGLANRLREHGIETLEDVMEASVDKLTETKGVTEDMAEDWHRQLS